MSEDSRINSPASLWLRILERAQTPARSMLFGYWLRGDARRPAEFRQECDTRGSLPELLKELRRAVDALPYGDAPGMHARPHSRSPTWLPTARSLGSIGLALLITGVVLFIAVHDNGRQTYKTSVGVYKRHVLPDGSTVELNTNTEIRTQITGTRRDIELVRGEVHFQVAHNPIVPFKVSAAGTVVRATGTAFTVRVREGPRVDVLVTDGSVIVRHDPTNDHAPGFSSKPGQSAVSEKEISAGDFATDDKGQIASAPIGPEDVEARQSWRHGLLIFRDQPLREVAAELNRYNRVQIFVSPSLAELRVNGQFRTTEPDVFLRRLVDRRPIHVRRSTSTASPGETVYLQSAEEPGR